MKKQATSSSQLSAISSYGDSGLVSPPPKATQWPSASEYEKMHAQSLQDPEAFWAEAARELEWYEPWHQVLDRSAAPFYRWFAGGKTNVILNAIDRHAAGERRNHTAIIWESESGDRRRLTYGDLDREVSKFANVLAS